MNQHPQQNNPSWTLIFAAWLVAAMSTLSSLFFSEVMDLIPCVLCWYQRIFMFPLAIILLVALFPLDTRVVKYAIPITVIGMLFAVYHIFLFYGVIPEGLQPCGKGISCADVSMELFGFLPIPILSFVAFVIIFILLFKTRNQS